MNQPPIIKRIGVPIDLSLLEGNNGQVLQVQNGQIGTTPLPTVTPLAVGSPIVSGVSGGVFYEGAGTIDQDPTNFFWDVTNTRLKLGGGIRIPYLNIIPLQRTVPTTNGDAVNLGSFTLTAGGGNFEIWVTIPSGGYSQSKRYFLPASYNGTNNIWQTLVPISTTGSYLTEDSDLEINSNNLVTSFRLRRLAATGLAAIADIIIFHQGVETDVFTPSTTSATVSAPTSLYANTLLTQLGGMVGVNIKTPLATHHINSSTGATAVANSLLIERFTRPATSGVKWGNALDILLGSYDTGINSQSRVDFKLADGASNDPDTTVLTLLANGRVGIGTTAPTTTLEVNGDVTVDGLTASQGVVTDGNKKLVSTPISIIAGTDRKTGLSAAQALATYTVGAADTTYMVSANVNVTTSTLHSFNVICTYTDETNTSRVLNLSFSNLAGTFLQTITNALGVGAYEGIPLHIRAKAGTTIILSSTGTFTTVTYSLEERIVQL